MHMIVFIKYFSKFITNEMIFEIILDLFQLKEFSLEMFLIQSWYEEVQMCHDKQTLLLVNVRVLGHCYLLF